jgi:acyl-ACP thioesterase
MVMSEAEKAEQGIPFSIRLFARWPDIDFNQHMRNAAYLGGSEDRRMRFLADRGFTMEEFRKRQRKQIQPPDQLKAAWDSLERTADFAWYD